MVHYANDYFDLEADRANRTPTAWSGGSRVLPGGELPPRVALVMALLLAGVAACAALILAVAVGSGPWTLPMIGVALALSWAYSAPPFRLHSRGVGELTTIVVVPLLAPLLGFYLQTGYLAGWLFAALFPLCCFQLTMWGAIAFGSVALLVGTAFLELLAFALSSFYV